MTPSIVLFIHQILFAKVCLFGRPIVYLSIHFFSEEMVGMLLYAYALIFLELIELTINVLNSLMSKFLTIHHSQQYGLHINIDEQTYKGLHFIVVDIQ